jgi:hypothetical protein
VTPAFSLPPPRSSDAAPAVAARAAAAIRASVASRNRVAPERAVRGGAAGGRDRSPSPPEVEFAGEVGYVWRAARRFRPAEKSRRVGKREARMVRGLVSPATGRRLRVAALSTAFAPAAALCALANDSTAELTAGGLVLAKSADIEMRSEDLAISDKLIDVHYRFFNRAAADVAVTVAFPMPDIVWDGPDVNIAVPDPDSPNFLDFHTFVDGREVVAQNQQKAFSGGVDISQRLTALGVPLAPQRQATWKALDGLKKADQDALVKAGIAVPDDYDAGKGWEHHLAPRWTLKSSFFWTQTFPAGREIAVEHRYKPSVGETVGTMLGSPSIDAEELARYQKLYCVDSDFIAGAKRAQNVDASGELRTPFYEKRIAYVLTTGANWAGPIGDFRLTIDKGAPDSLVSFCADGVKKIAPTVFEVRHANFTPTRDLNVLILYRPPK